MTELIIGIVGPITAALATVLTARITSRARVDEADERDAAAHAATIAALEARIEEIRAEAREQARQDRAKLRQAHVTIDAGREYIHVLRMDLIRARVPPPEWPELLRRLM